MTTITKTSVANISDISYYVYHYPIREVLASNILPMAEMRCLIADGHSKNMPLRITQFCQITLSLIGIIFLLLTLNKFKRKFECLDYNFRIFVWILCGFAIWHNACTIILHSWHNIYYIFYQGCDRLTVSWHGVLVRGSQQLGVVGLNIAEIVILLDRIWASFQPFSYGNERAKAIYIFIILLFTVPLATVIYIFGKEFNSNPISYFTMSSPTSAEQTRNVFFSLLFLNFLAFIGFIILLLKNKKMLKIKAHNFNVNLHFQMYANVRSLRFSISLMISSLIINVLTFTVQNYLRIDNDLKSYHVTCFEIEATYLLYFHALGIAIVLFIDNQSLRPSTKVRALSWIEEGELHFESIKNAWN